MSLPLTRLFVSVLLFFSSIASAQEFYTCDSYSNIRKVSIVNGVCNSTLSNQPCSNFGGYSIAIYKDTFYRTYSGGLFRSIINNGTFSTCTLINSGFTINSLTVDSTGTLYGALSYSLYKINPYTGVITLLGIMPYRSAGDLVFYKGELYMAADAPISGIVKVNINTPSLSTMHIPMPAQTQILGLVNVPINCTQNKLYAMNSVGVSTELIELNMELQTVVGTICILPYFVYDAASPTETGQPAPVVLRSIITKPMCRNSTANGSIQINSLPGVGTYSYTLNNTVTNTTGLFNNLPAGSYSIQIVSPGGCLKDTTATVLLADTPTVNLQINNAICSSNSGSIISTTSGGLPPYQYSLNNGALQASGTYNNLGMGNYYLQVTDSNKCSVSLSATVSSEIPPLVQSVSVNAAICNHNNGSIIVSSSSLYVTGYSLNNGSQQVIGQFINLAAGNYLVSTFTGQGCRYDTTVTIQSNYPAIVQTITISSSICNSNNGSIVISPSNNASGYSLNNGVQQTSNQFLNLVPGNYIVSSFTSQGCRYDTTVTVNIIYPIIAQTITIGSSTCNSSNGSITVTAVNASGYSLNNGTQQATGNFTTLPPGNYLISTFTSQGCRYDSMVTVGVIYPSQFQNINVTSATCNLSNGMITVNPPANAIGYSINNGSQQTSGQFINLATGNYIVTTFTNQGCRYDSSITISNVNDVLPSVTITATSPDCYGRANGSMIITVNGANPPYRISFNGGSFSNQFIFTNLMSGNFPVRIQSGNGCIKDTSAIVPIFKLVKPGYTIITNAPSCIQPQTGTIRFAITINPASYKINYKNSNYNAGFEFKNLLAGSHFFSIYDQNNCLADTVTVQLSELRFANCDTIYVPTAFTPNKDGKNDFFKATAYGIMSEYYISVYNRYGQVVFSSSDVQKGWDGTVNGKLQGAGIYIWSITYVKSNRFLRNLRGTVVLIR